MNKFRKTKLISLLICLFLAINIFIPIITYPGSSINDVNESKEIQTSSNYEYEWLVSYGGEMMDWGYGINIDSLNNTYVTGYQDGSGPLCLLKYNNNGSLLWNKTWRYGRGQDIAIDDLDSIYITGNYYFNGTRQICLLKYNSSGDLQMNKTWGGSKYGMGHGIDIDNEGNIYITGYFFNTGEDDYLLVLLKYDSFGDLVWSKTLDIPSSGEDIVVDDNGNIYITGYIENGLNKIDLCLLIYDSSGNLEGEHLWGGPEDDCGNGIVLDDSGMIYITGYKQNSLNDFDLCLLSYDNTSTLHWAKTWGGDEKDFGIDIKIDDLGYIYITGATGSFKPTSNFVDVLLAKFDKNGNNLGFKTWGAHSGTDYGFGLVLDDWGYAYITGTGTYPLAPFDNFWDLIVIKYDLDKIPIKTNIAAISGYNISLSLIAIGIISVVLLLIKRDKFNSN